MKFTLTMDCDNAAFEERPADEIGRILRRTAEQIELIQPVSGEGGSVLDIDGNTVGEWKVRG